MNESVGSRQANLSRILRLVHLDGPISRATLTSATGLNRSTIADLVGDLATLGLVEERAPDPSRRVGRPSPLVSAHPDVVAVAANPEVDALTLAVVGLDRGVRRRERIEMTDLLTPERTAELIGERVATWRADDLADARIVGVGVAVPGLVRASDGLVRDAPHLGWRDTALRELVEAATGLPTAVGNDAAFGVLAEHLFGAARGFDDVVYLNGGASGIGGGLIVHGMPVGGASGYSGEFGQNRPGIAAVSDRRADDGVLEDEVSRSRLLAVLGHGNVDEPELARLLRSAEAPEVLDEIARQRRILATALANAVNVLNPAVVVLGGFLAMLAAGDTAGLTDAVAAQTMHANGEDFSILPAALAEDRLLIGAAEAAFGELLHDPAGAAS
ncbi:ROK family transcriptional regulator [Microbacterium sp. NEAU-LLC]|uniref:ROK family transcriptional regulator n=1 Tax=Microbacterium helvum TaxID=2773713 RepID=A0ABR8NRE7_9MICO|nr:ROK family transcriptional regulator [Microbacterium helvum]MBD3943216.1 ROK family transcriptional regulator [Microbacterium helvum]